MSHIMWHLFHEFVFVDLLFIPEVTSLWHHCNIFVALFITFSYEDKCLAQHWTTHNWCIH